LVAEDRSAAASRALAGIPWGLEGMTDLAEGWRAEQLIGSVRQVFERELMT
jgi:hypothetical protein